MKGINETIKAEYPKEISFVHNTARKRIGPEGPAEAQKPYARLCENGYHKTLSRKKWDQDQKK